MRFQSVNAVSYYYFTFARFFGGLEALRRKNRRQSERKRTICTLRTAPVFRTGADHFYLTKGEGNGAEGSKRAHPRSR